MLGVLCHVLHAIGHFIDGRGHQFHLLRLLLAALLSLRGVVAQFAGRLAQGAGRHLQITDHPAQLGGEGVEVMRQFSDFIFAMGVEAAGQVAFTAGNVGHGVHGFLQWADDAARDEDHQQRHDHGDHQADDRSLDHLAPEFRLHIVDVNPGAEHPAPRFEKFDVGRLGHRLTGARFWPAVVDHARAFRSGDGDHFVEHRKAVRVTDRREVLAFEFRVGRVHDHHGREVVDPEVIALVVTQAANCRQRLFLCSLFAQGAGGFEVVVIGQQAAGGLHDVLGFLGFGMVEIVVDLLEHQHAQGQQHDHRHNQDEPQASADRHTAQAVHNAVTPVFFYLS
ncbi:hypothetical protein D3C81_1295420 [compost metagenome]